MAKSTPKKKSRWIKYTLAVLGCGFLLCFLVLATILVVFDDDDYRRLAIWSVKYFTGYTLIVEGPFALEISSNLSLSAENIRFESGEGKAPPAVKTIGRFAFQIALPPLVTGTLVVKELEADDAVISATINDLAETKGDFEDNPIIPRDLHLPILESLQLSNIHLDIIDAGANRTIDIRLRKFYLDDVQNAGPLYVSGKGTVSWHEFDINGRMGALVAMLKGEKPFPIDGTVNFAGTKLSIMGTFQDFVELEGMKLQVSGEAAELADVLSLLKIEMPPLGRLNFEATIIHDLSEPKLPFVSVALSGNPDIQFSANGSIANASNLAGMHLDFAGACSIPEIFRIFGSTSLGLLERARVSGSLQEAGGTLSVEKIKLEALSKEGATGSAVGRFELGDNIRALTVNNIDLALDTFFPTSELLKPVLFERLPEVGPVVGTSRLTGSLEALSLEDLEIKAGGKGPLQLSYIGRVSGQVIDNDLVLSGFDLDTTTESETTAILGTAYGVEIPELGAVTASYRLVGDLNRFRLGQLKVHTISSAGLKTNFNGQIIFERKENQNLVGEFDIAAAASAPGVTAAATPFGFKDLPDIKHLRVRAKIAGTTDAVSLKDIFLDVGAKGPLRGDLKGNIERIPFSKSQSISGIKLSTTVAADRTAALSDLLDLNLPELGPLNGSCLVTGSPGKMAISNIKLATRSDKGLKLEAGGKISQFRLKNKKPLTGLNVTIKASAPGLAAVPGLAEVELPDLGSFQMEASVKDRDTSIDVDSFKITSTSGSSSLLSIQGKIRDAADPKKRVLEALFETASEPWVRTYLRQKDGNNTTLKGNLRAKATDGRLRIDKFSLRTAEGKALDFSATGDIQNMTGPSKVDFNIEAHAPDPNLIGSIVGISIPKLEPIRVNGRISGKIPNISFYGNAYISDTKFSANLDTTLVAGRPRINGKIAAKTVDLRDIGIYPKSSPVQSAAEKTAPTKQKRMFGDQPLFPFEALKVLDLSLTLDAENLVDHDISVRNLDIDIVLEKGRLAIDPLRMAYRSGYSDFHMVIDASGPVPWYEVKITGEDINIDDVLSRAHEPVVMSGSLNLVTELSSSGHSAREIAANLNGVVSLALENGKIWRIIDLLSKDALDILLTKIDQRVYTDVHCLMNKISFEAGIGTIDILSIDTPKIRARGAGNVNLANETFELVINPQRKRRLLQRRSAVRLEGSLVNPSVSTMPLSEAAELYGTIILPFVFLPERALGFLWSVMKNDKDATPCIFEGQ